ncbi:flagellar type III secretion system pore protein FliP [Buchnera aphidicola]
MFSLLPHNLSLFQIISSLSQVIFFILICVWFLKKISFLKKYKKLSLIKIIDKISVGTYESIIIVDIQEKKIVLGVTRKNISYLYTLPSMNIKDQNVQIKDQNVQIKDQNVQIKDQNVQIKDQNVQIKDQNVQIKDQNVQIKDQNVQIKDQNVQILKKIFYYFKKILIYFQTTLILFLFCPTVYADVSNITNNMTDGGDLSWSIPVQTLVFLSLLTFIPAFLLMMTGFTRIIIVFGLLRNALGTPYAPPNQILIGLALFLTFFVMSPTIDKVYINAYKPFSNKTINMQEAIVQASIPLKTFMSNQTRISDLELFSKLAHLSSYKDQKDIPMRVLLPAFIISELKTAFQIGFTIFIPFLIIDLVVASVLMALGMMMVPPATIALPLKLILFVLVDGWQLLVSSLIQSFNV